MSDEIWKDVKGFEDAYMVSNNGRIKSLAKNVEVYRNGKTHQRKRKCYIFNKPVQRDEYVCVTLSKGTEKVYDRVHRLVAKAFIPNPYNKSEINHKDGIKSNNRVENLEWVTRQENITHSIRTGLGDFKSMNYYNQRVKPRTLYQYSLDYKYINKHHNSTEAGEQTGVCSRNILQVASGDEYAPGKTRKQAGGYIWSYKRRDELVAL